MGEVAWQSGEETSAHCCCDEELTRHEELRRRGQARLATRQRRSRLLDVDSARTQRDGALFGVEGGEDAQLNVGEGVAEELLARAALHRHVA
eukprot:963785-Pleurochrysis_carterae.AAC.2